MKILRPGDPCPCCGQPLPEGLPIKTMTLLSWLAEGRAIVALSQLSGYEVYLAEDAGAWG